MSAPCLSRALNVSVVNDGSDLTWIGHSTLFFGNVLTGYDLDIFESNVRILVNPLFSFCQQILQLGTSSPFSKRSFKLSKKYIS